MRKPVEYRLIPQDTVEFESLQQFAQSFNHKIIKHPKINHYAHYRGEKLIGYSDHVFIPTVYPAFHPEFTNPRDVVQVMSDWKTHCQLSATPGIIGVPFDNNGGNGNFPEAIMQKLGLIRLNRELYCPA
jgi:hypothetical protein